MSKIKGVRSMASSIFSVGSDTSSNLFSSMFGTSSSSSSSTGSSSVLGDYAMIRSGAYTKLLKSYYNKNSTSATSSSSTEESTETKKAKTGLATLKTAAQDLKSAASALNSTSGTGTDRLEKAQSFVKAYNSLLDSTENVDDTKSLQKTIWMINDFKANSGLLSDVGITIGTDNKLSIDEEKFKAANTSTLDSLFTGRNSMVGKASSKAYDIVNSTNTALSKLDGGSIYTDKGSYTSLTTGSLYNSLF
jgi:hypothetical protein